MTEVPSVLKAFQKPVLALCSSSDASMSGVTSASIVGVNVWIASEPGSIVRDNGKPRPFRNSTELSPIATSSFGWMMCSSRVSHAFASSASSVPNLRQFVP